MGPGCVLVVEDDPAIGILIEEILAEEGLAVAVLRPLSPEALREWVERETPGCVLLDGGRPDGFGQSWQDAAWLAARVPRIPVVMFSVDRMATQEARARQSARSQAAAFAAVLDKPFDLDALVAAVTGIVHSTASAPSPGAAPMRAAAERANPSHSMKRLHEVPTQSSQTQLVRR